VFITLASNFKMGYFEIPCRLCGVSFNIGRVRRQHESQSEGWTATGDGRMVVEGRGQCDVSDGCRLVRKRVNYGLRDIVWGGPSLSLELGFEEDDDDDDNDSDYIDDEQIEDDEYEFETDDDNLVANWAGAVDDVDMENNGDEKKCRTTPKRLIRCHWTA
jgi:hypothetical protein